MKRSDLVVIGEYNPSGYACVYGLREPDASVYGYIGMTAQSSPRLRLEEHWGITTLSHTKVGRWLAKAKREGWFPEMVVIEGGVPEEIGEAERWWIAKYFELGHPLKNLTEGGETGKLTPEGYESYLNATARNPEYCQMRSKISKEMWQNPEFREAQIEASKRTAQNPGWRRKNQQHLTRVRENPELEAKRLANLRAQAARPEAREKKRATRIRQFAESPECRQKVVETFRQAVATPGAKRNFAVAMEKLRQDPEYQRKRIEGIRATLRTPEHREKRCQQMHSRLADPEWRKNLIERQFESSRARNQFGLVGVKAVGKRFGAQIRIEGKSVYLGVVSTPEAAARAYDVKSWEQYHNPNLLNFPEDYAHLVAPIPLSDSAQAA